MLEATRIHRPSVRLEDKYEREAGLAFMTGIQALVRLPIEQARRDRARGLRIGTFISGYQGSPLGGYDIALVQARRYLEPLDIHHVPGLNEELGAAAVWGSQMTELFRRSSFDGVTGIWYGKSPGVDRCIDLFRHGNVGGSPEHGSMLALAGDDPAGKSSTIPNQSEWDFVACGMPVLYPGSVSELLELGLHGIAMSRYTGLWVALKATTNVCDGGETVQLSAAQPAIRLPELPGFVRRHSFVIVPPVSLELERHLFEQRLPAAVAYARANELNRIVRSGPRDRIGIIAGGKIFADVNQAVSDLGLDARQPNGPGVRLLKVGLIYPLDPEIVRRFADGLEEIIVVEEKRDLLESQVRNVLYASPHRPIVVGKYDQDGRPLVPWHGELEADLVAEIVGPRLLRLAELPSARARLEELRRIRARPYPALLRRAPNYCSGCPHNRSTVLVDGEPAGAGIGCHGMAVLQTQEKRQAVVLGPMGAEGATWIGAAPFVETSHFTQNVGDGTFFHSASQALRACVAANVNITFKLLYNYAVAMTGGQAVAGARAIDHLTHALSAEGVKQTIVVAEEPDRFRGQRLASNAKVYPRDDYERAIRELRAIPGVTVLIFDQQCAAEKRRARKRGLLPQPDKYIVINEDVCEGCGDCGDVSNCMSLVPVETELGRKTQVHQSSCNKDYSCLKGDCPSFVTLYSADGPAKTRPRTLAETEVPEPAVRARVDDAYRIYMPGIGGTGVVTANQILAYAAIFDGYYVQTLDQTGMAQKGGSVISSLIVTSEPSDPDRSNKVGLGRADLVLGFDTLGIASPVNADRLSPARTVVVGDLSMQPTADVIRNVNLLLPGRTQLQHLVDTLSRAEANVWVEAGQMAEALFGDHVLTNVFLVGVAYQAGLLPMRGSSIEAAIRLNGTAVEANLQAFRHGRLFFHQPGASARPEAPREQSFDAVRSRYLGRLGGPSSRNGRTYLRLLDRCASLSEDGRRMLALRVGELILYQDPAYAARYLASVMEVFHRERQALPGSEALTRAVIRYLYKLMAYKDEYEVARLLLHGEAARRLPGQFVAPRIRYNLHPPLLRALGLRRKLELGSWARPGLEALARLRRLRGSPLDPFGQTKVRKLERELVGWYLGVLREVLSQLRPETHAMAVEIASAPDRIRGYEEIKVRNAEQARRHVADKLDELRRSRLTA